MSKVVIVTDSTSYIPDALREEYQIIVAPQVLIWGDKMYEDGVDIQPDEFYTSLKTASIMPTTSQATIACFHKIFTQQIEQGNEVLAVLLSNKLSGTIDSALQARDLLPPAPIEVVDSNTVAMALGFQVLAVAKAAKAGASLAECKALAEQARNHTGVVFAVDTLEFLHRGGRIGGGSRFLATALNIKPILEVRDGRVEAVERIRTRKKSLARLIEIIEEQTKGKQPVRVATLHANAAEEAKELLKELNNRVNPIESVFSTVSPVVGTHAGPGTIGIAYMAGM